MFVVLLCCCCHIWGTRHILKSLLVAFGWDTDCECSCCCITVSLVLSGKTCFFHSSLLWQDTLSLVSFLVSRWAACWKPLFFPESGVMSPVCGFSLAHRSWSIFLRALWWLDLLLLPHSGTCTRIWPQWKGAGDVGLAFGVLGVPTDLVGRVREILQRLVGRFPGDVLK